MIDPAGDVKNPGRKIDNNFERTLTFNFVENLKNRLQEKYNLRCILTRSPGEQVFELQNASFANRLNADFYLSVHIFKSELVKPSVFIYNLVYNSVFDLANRVIDSYKFVSIDQAHFLNIKKTQYFGQHIKNCLTQENYKKNFDFYGLYGIPVKSLVGIIAPALIIELGVADQEQINSLIDPIIESLSFLNITR